MTVSCLTLILDAFIIYSYQEKLNSNFFTKLRGIFLCKKISYTCLPHFFLDLDVLEIAYLPPPPHLLSVYWMSERESEILAVKGLKPCYLRPGRLCIWVSSAPVTGCRLRLRPGGGARPGQARRDQGQQQNSKTGCARL